MEKIVVCDISNISPKTLSFDNIAEYYETISDEMDKNVFWYKFSNIIMYEYRTLLMIMSITNPDINILSKNISVNLNDNYIINKLLIKLGSNDLSEILKPIGLYLKNVYRNYLDVFSRDLENINNMEILKDKSISDKQNELYRPVILFSNNEYIGHIYNCNNINNDDEAMFVGIRESLNNVFNKIYHLNAIKNVGFKLLDSARRYISINHKNIIIISIFNPIGPMKCICDKYGFVQEDDDGNMIMCTKDTPKIYIEPCEINILQ